MKGIKECINWMLNNPKKELHPENLYFNNVRFNSVTTNFESTDDTTWDAFQSFRRFKETNWEEVIELVDFITAYNDCLENDAKYKNEDETHQMYGCSHKESDWKQVNIQHFEDANGTDCVMLCGNWIKITKEG